MADAEPQLRDACAWFAQVGIELEGIREIDPAEDYEVVADWSRGIEAPFAWPLMDEVA